MGLVRTHPFEQGEVESALMDGLRNGAQRPQLGSRKAAGPQFVVGAGEEGVAAHVGQARGEASVNGLGAGGRDLLRDDNPGEPGKARRAVAQGRGACFGRETGDEFPVGVEKQGEGVRKGGFVVERAQGHCGGGSGLAGAGHSLFGRDLARSRFARHFPGRH